jgi:hypothetical protein
MIIIIAVAIAVVIIHGNAWIKLQTFKIIGKV